MDLPQFTGPLFTPLGEVNASRGPRPPAPLFGPGIVHPKPPINISPDSVNGRRKPVGTNKWYTQLVLSPSGTDPVYVLPYALAFLDGRSVLSQNGQASNFVGLGVSHSTSSSRVFGPPEGTDGKGPSKFYYNPLVMSVCLGAEEITQSNIESSLSQWSELTAQFKIFSSNSRDSNMVLPISRGSALVTCLYTNLTPTIRSAHDVLNCDCLNEGKEAELHGFRKYRIKLGDGSTWLIYAMAKFVAPGSFLELIKKDNKYLAHRHGSWSGTVQVVKMSDYYANYLGSNFHRLQEEAVYDKGVGVWVEKAVIRSGPIDSGTYYFDWFSGGPCRQFVQPLIFALPHHIEAMPSASSLIVSPNISLNSRVTGDMLLCRGSSWCFEEDLRNVKSYGIGPVDLKDLKSQNASSKLDLLRDILIKEMEGNFNQESDLDSYYFSGKKLAKQALICLTASSILRDEDLTSVCVAKTKESLQKFCQNRQKAARLVYENSWRGIISSSMLATGNENDDFGNGIYNDHHFHFAYFIHTASVLVHFDHKFLSEIRNYVEDLIRDTNNAAESDEYFPLFRNFDWFLGHSLATGLATSLDGKNQESCSEDVNFFYALRLWGQVTHNRALESLAELQLCLLKRSADHYYYMRESNTSVPPAFKRNRVPGILFENKADYTTFFSNEKDAIHMIQVIPITPITPFFRSLEFVRQEWTQSGSPFDRSNQICHLATNLTNGYRTLLLLQYASVDPEFVWNFFEERIRNKKEIPLDDGLSLTWLLGFVLSQLNRS